jgi:hypothetical protein
MPHPGCYERFGDKKMSCLECDPIEILIKHGLDVRDDEMSTDVINKAQELFNYL